MADFSAVTLWGVLSAGVAFAVGAGLWTFAEYNIHRFLGHHPRFRGNIFEKEHTRHHSVGNYFAPAIKKAGAAILAAILLGGPSVWLLGALVGGAFTLGFALMYLTYEGLHWLDHVHPGWTPRMRRLRRHHFWHHFGSPKLNHGVTTTFWDRVYGTYAEPGVIRVPKKLAMRWLVDDRTGAVRTEHAAHYRLQ